MAFTVPELFLGALVAWVAFETLIVLLELLLLLVTDAGPSGTASASMLSSYLTVSSLSSGIVILLFGVPAAWLLGTILRRLRRMAIHLVAFALLGAFAAAFVLLVVLRMPVDSRGPLILWLCIPAAGTAAALGWWSTASLALRRDAQATGAP